MEKEVEKKRKEAIREAEKKREKIFKEAEEEKRKAEEQEEQEGREADAIRADDPPPEAVQSTIAWLASWVVSLFLFPFYTY